MRTNKSLLQDSTCNSFFASKAFILSHDNFNFLAFLKLSITFTNFIIQVKVKFIKYRIQKRTIKMEEKGVIEETVDEDFDFGELVEEAGLDSSTDD